MDPADRLGIDLEEGAGQVTRSRRPRRQIGYPGPSHPGRRAIGDASSVDESMVWYGIGEPADAYPSPWGMGAKRCIIPDGWIAISFAGKVEDVQKSPIAHLASALPSPCGIPLPLLDSGGNALPIGWVLRAAFRCSVHDSQSCKADIVRVSGQKYFPTWLHYISRLDHITAQMCVTRC